MNYQLDISKEYQNARKKVTLLSLAFSLIFSLILIADVLLVIFANEDYKLNQRLVFPYKPKMVVYYVGINNVINSKQDATTIWNNLKNFFDHTHAALPDTKVQYIMMNLIPGFKTYFDTINAVNANVVNYQKENTWLTLINPGTALLKENGEPNAAYFRTDGLHLSYYGYVVWGNIIKQSIVNGLENN